MRVKYNPQRPRGSRKRKLTSEEKKKLARSKKRERRQKRRRFFWRICPFLFLLFVICGVVFMKYTDWQRARIDHSAIDIPDWIQPMLLTPNPYSRPGDPLGAVNGIVVHYVANPGSTAERNRAYFENLAVQQEESATSVSSHFIIGLKGEIIQCVPLDEIAYASNYRNSDTISIECCHPDETGEFTKETYESLVRLTSWLSKEFRLGQEEVIRHYDVTGKKCPLYYVNYEDAWSDFKLDVKKEGKRK